MELKNYQNLPKSIFFLILGLLGLYPTIFGLIILVKSYISIKTGLDALLTAQSLYYFLFFFSLSGFALQNALSTLFVTYKCDFNKTGINISKKFVTFVYKIKVDYKDLNDVVYKPKAGRIILHTNRRSIELGTSIEPNDAINFLTEIERLSGKNAIFK